MAREQATQRALPPVCFMHIPKTAGTKVRTLLGIGLGGVTFSFTDPDSVSAAWRLDPWVFAGATLVSGHFGSAFLDRLRFPHLAVSVLRHPVARTVSHYLYDRKLDLSRLPAADAARIAATRGLPLTRLLSSEDPALMRQYRNLQARFFAGRGTLDPAGDPEPDSGLLDRALARARRFEFIGFQEHLGADLARLFARLSLPPPSDPEGLANAGPDAGAAREIMADRDQLRAIERANEVDLALYDMLKSAAHD